MSEYISIAMMAEFYFVQNQAGARKLRMLAVMVSQFRVYFYKK